MLYLALAALTLSAPTTQGSRATLDLFAEHDAVAIGEHHGMTEDDAFILSVVHEPGFADAVDIVVIEFASGAHQGLLDRYVVDGEDLSKAEVAPVFVNHTHSAMGVIESPFYESLLASIRDLNTKLEPADRVRVVAGDPPVDWDSDDLPSAWRQAMGQRDTFWADAALRAGLNRGRHTLLIGGTGHFISEPGRSDNVVAILADAGHRPYVVAALGREALQTTGLAESLADAPCGTIVPTSGSAFAQHSSSDFFPGNFTIRDGEMVPSYQGLPISTAVDAILYLGPVENMSDAETFPKPTDPGLTALVKQRQESLGIRMIED